MAELNRTGGCLCGAVRYRLVGPVRDVLACHCHSCRRGSGHYVAATAVPRAQLRVQGEPRWFLVGPHARRGFCANCGSFLFWDDPRRSTIGILAGTLDAPTGLSLRAHIFTAEKGDYYDIPEQVPQHPEFEPHGHERSA